MRNQPIAFYELVMCCREHGHKPFGNTGEILRSGGLLLGDDRPHDTIRNIVLSAVSGEGLEMTLGSPIQQ